MKALVYHGPGFKRLEDVPLPRLQEPCDALVRVTHTTICGTDLHILRGDLPEVTPGRVLGHEGLGTVVSVGPGVVTFRPGDPVIISCVTSCGRCEYCRRGIFSQCADGGWQLGHKIDGTQAEFVRIRYADTSLLATPRAAALEPLVMLSDVLPTAYECGVLAGSVRPGQILAIVGAGPVGLSVILTARLFSPAQIIAIDTDDTRLEAARAFGATTIIDNADDNAAEEVLDHTEGRGVDLAVEAAGNPATFELCQQIVAPGGRIANIGVHGKPVTLHIERLWAQNVTLTTRLVDTISAPELLKAIRRGAIDPARLITHRFAFSAILDAYDVFAGADEARTLKVLISP